LLDFRVVLAGRNEVEFGGGATSGRMPLSRNSSGRRLALQIMILPQRRKVKLTPC
jgi:hypothetical protein